MRMDKPICITQLFVDKQNVRSYGNILKQSLLKQENEKQFLQSILMEDKSLVSKLSHEILQIISTLRKNLQKVSKDDFKYFFPKTGSTIIVSLNKADVLENCCNALDKIIPESFFGNRQNQNLFIKVIQSIIYGMKRQHILLGKALRKWNYSTPPWISLSESAKVLHNMIVWILQNILSPMICLNYHVTTSKQDADENKLHYFWKNHWQKFYDKKIHGMVKKGIIKKVDSLCLGKKPRKNYDINTLLQLKNIKKDTPKLHLFLKIYDDFRPIIRYKNETLTLGEKYKIKNRLNFLKLLTGTSNTKMETLYNSIHLKWLKFNRPKLYFIKTDLSNAFGCVDKVKLMKILHERFLKYQKNEKSHLALEKNTVLFKEIVNELRKPILIRAGSTIYVWRKGLVQGYKYSPALSELYYRHMDELYFSEHMELANADQIRLFVRVVDDYLYITDSLADAKEFLKALSNYHNVNNEKTIVNFPHEKIKFCNEITFLGYSYNTLDMQVSRAPNVYVGQMCYKITFNDSIENLSKFIESRISQSSVKINSHIFNLFHNKESLVWEHIFITFALSANKFCTILALLSDVDEMANYLVLYKKKVTVKLGNTMMEVLSKNKPREFMFVYCVNHFRYISWLALSLCVKQTPKCSVIGPIINTELSKSNCIFGKWREHASRIDTNGLKLRDASRVVCRRSDLRVIMKKFVSLPDGFQCYNRKLIYSGK